MNLDKQSFCNAPFIGGTLLIIGTSIGGGMLGLPVSSAQGGFLGASLMLFVCWLFMTLGALLILEVNLALPMESNLISMARKTLGQWGEIIAWLTYLLLLYSLLAAYTSGGADVLGGILNSLHISLDTTMRALIFLLIFGAVVFLGIQSTDYVNRVLMFFKLGAFLVLILLGAPHAQLPRLEHQHVQALIPALSIFITSFGFATIVPSLRVYFKSDVVKLRKAIFIGSAIPLICYIAWIAMILSDIPLHGPNGMIAMLASPQPTSALVNAIQLEINSSWVSNAARVFTSICVATSFLGVSLCLVDFLSDGLSFQKSGAKKLFIHALAFIPPFLITILYPRAFLVCLSYAGVLCAILLIIMPAFMAWQRRYHLNLPTQYQLRGGKFLLSFVLLFGLCVIVQEILSNFSHFHA